MESEMLTKNLPIELRLSTSQSRLIDKVNRLKQLGLIFDYKVAQPEEDYEGIDLWIRQRENSKWKSVQAKGRESGEDFIVERTKIYRKTIGDNLEDFQTIREIGRDYKSLLSGNYQGVFNFVGNNCHIISAKKLLQEIQLFEENESINYSNLELVYPFKPDGQRNQIPKFPICKTTGIDAKYVFNYKIENYAKVILYVPKKSASLNWYFG